MTSSLATWCADAHGIDDRTADEARRHLLDWIGLVAGGRRHADSSTSVLDAVRTLAGEPPAGVPVGHELPPDRAALLAGTFAHSLDYDDTHLASSLHPGAPVIAAVLPIARREEASAETLLAAIAQGYDVTCAVGRALDPEAHYDRGFHVTATCGGFGAAAAIGRLLDFDAEAYQHAFGIAGSQAAGSLQFLSNGAWNKRLHPGLAARRGVLAATLADEGFRGAARPFRGEHGFLQGYSDDPHPERLAEVASGRALRETGLKPYPCCRYLHPAIDACLDLAPAVDVDDVTAITVDLPAPGVRLTGEPIDRKRRPANVVDRQFSAPFAAATALDVGAANLDAFRADPAPVDLMDRVDVISTDRTNGPYPDRWSAHVTVDGADRHERFVDRPLGEPERPLGRDALEAKVRELVDETPVDGDEIVEVVESLGSGSDADALFSALGPT